MPAGRRGNCLLELDAPVEKHHALPVKEKPTPTPDDTQEKGQNKTQSTDAPPSARKNVADVADVQSASPVKERHTSFHNHLRGKGRKKFQPPYLPPSARKLRGPFDSVANVDGAEINAAKGENQSVLLRQNFNEKEPISDLPYAPPSARKLRDSTDSVGEGAAVAVGSNLTEEDPPTEKSVNLFRENVRGWNHHDCRAISRDRQPSAKWSGVRHGRNLFGNSNGPTNYSHNRDQPIVSRLERTNGDGTRGRGSVHYRGTPRGESASAGLWGEASVSAIALSLAAKDEMEGGNAKLCYADFSGLKNPDEGT